MRPYLISAALCMAVATAGCAVAAPGPTPGARALDDVRILSADDMEGRGIATPGGAKARAYLLQRFAQIGLRPQGAAWAGPASMRAKAMGARKRRMLKTSLTKPSWRRAPVLRNRSKCEKQRFSPNAHFLVCPFLRFTRHTRG